MLKGGRCAVLRRLRLNIRKVQWNARNWMKSLRADLGARGFVEKQGVNWGVRKKVDDIDKLLVRGAVGSLVLVMVAGVILAAGRTHAEQTVQMQAAVTVSSSCQVTSVLNSAHEAEVTASTYRDNIGKTTVTVACNDANGYDMYAVGFTNTEFGRNDMLGASTGRTIDTGTATSGDTSAWAMKLTAVTGQVAPTITTGYTAYHTVPDEYVKVASYSSSTMEDALGSRFETTYAVYADSLQAPDTYVGKVKYTLVHPSDATSAPCAATYTINYNNNGGSGTMDSQTMCPDRTVGILPNGFTAPAPTAETKFAVWNTAADGSGYTYLPGQSVANLADAGGSVTLYAQWAPKYIQDLTAAKCETVTQMSPLTVYDRRDDSDYTVRYLEGACWMTQNLRIKGAVRSQYSNFSTNTTVNVCEGDLTAAGDSYDEARCHDSENTTNGVWYNFAAASAKTILTSSNSNEATEDICPAGWHLPNRDTTKPAGSINSMAGVYETVRNAFTPVTGGYYNGGSISGSGNGYWWSSTTNSSYYRYYLYYNGSSLNANYNNYRYYGMYIRCVR